MILNVQLLNFWMPHLQIFLVNALEVYLCYPYTRSSSTHVFVFWQRKIFSVLLIHFDIKLWQHPYEHSLVKMIDNIFGWKCWDRTLLTIHFNFHTTAILTKQKALNLNNLVFQFKYLLTCCTVTLLTDEGASFGNFRWENFKYVTLL